jgi:two-component system phosphate regulon sensor histidine kinase PhoR
MLVLTALANSILVGLGSVWLFRRATEKNFADRLRSETALIAIMPEVQEDPRAFAVDAAKRLGVRMTLIAPDGTVLGDSVKGRGDTLRMDNHLDRPEIRAALSRGLGESVRVSDTTSEEYFYCARLVEGAGPVRFVRIAVPTSDMRALEEQYAWFATGVVLLAMLLLGTVAYVAVRRISAPVERMSELADRTARGDMDAEAPERGVDEVSRLGAAMNRMRRALREKIDQVQEERSLLSSVIGGMREGLLVVGPDLRVRLANDAARRILDLRFDPAGHLLAEVVRHPTVIRDVEQVVEGGREPESSVVRMEGSGRAFQMHVTALGKRGAEAGRSVLVLFFDITRLEALEGVRRDFVANVSHELRTPLTAIKAFVETLLDGGIHDPEHSVKFLEIARKHADRMEALIDDLTDLSLIETGSIVLEIGDLDASEVAREVVEQLRPRARALGVSVGIELPRPFPVRADRRRLEQILTNLVDNAIKFNRRDGEVHVRGVADEHRRTLVVEDTGVGIPSDSRDKIFHRFFRVDPDRSREAGGTGLGLAIVKHLVRLHGGSIRVESELGVGTRFELDLPPPALPDSGRPRPRSGRSG